MMRNEFDVIFDTRVYRAGGRGLLLQRLEFGVSVGIEAEVAVEGVRAGALRRVLRVGLSVTRFALGRPGDPAPD